MSGGTTEESGDATGSSSGDAAATGGTQNVGDGSSGEGQTDSSSETGNEGPTPPLPSPQGACPDFTNGTVTFQLASGTRTAQVWIDEAAAADMDGPLVMYWHGTGGIPQQAQQALGASIAEITSRGGIVVAPIYAGNGQFPWLDNGGSAEFPLVDEIVACAAENIGIDARRIHSLGFSAGALFTSALSFGRSSYIASVALYSGGFVTAAQDPNNKFAAMIFHGGAADNVYGVDFRSASQQYQTALLDAGHFAFVCDHGTGHAMPAEGPSSVLEFFTDHPFGEDPAAYADGFPAGMPSYCELPQ